MRPRLSIRALIVVIAVIAVGLTSLRTPTPVTASAAVTLLVTLLLASFLGIIYRRGPERAFCVGFAMFGWAYTILAFGPWFRDAVGEMLLASELIELTFKSMFSNQFNGMNLNRAFAVLRAEFRLIAHSEMALFIALLGGALARYAHATGPGQDERP